MLWMKQLETHILLTFLWYCITMMSRLFTQWFIQAHIKENIIAPRHWLFVWGIHRWPLKSPHKGPVMGKLFPFDDVIMVWKICNHNANIWGPIYWQRSTQIRAWVFLFVKITFEIVISGVTLSFRKEIFRIQLKISWIDKNIISKFCKKIPMNLMDRIYLICIFSGWLPPMQVMFITFEPKRLETYLKSWQYSNEVYSIPRNHRNFS